MKKIILFIVLIFPALSSQAQTFYSEDFSAGIPAGWTNVDISGNNILWRTTTTGSLNTNVIVDTLLNPVGTSAANGYLIIDSDSAGQGITEDALLTTSPINCSAHPNVHLVFNEYFAQYLSSTATVSVSNDNVTFTDFHLAHAGLTTNQGTPNPNFVDVDITAIAGGQSTVYIRFNYHGSWDYWWFIDDVQLYESPAVDLAVTSVEKLNSEYTLIPFQQATTLTLSAEVKNNGALASVGGSALFEVINIGTAQTVFSESIALPSIAVGAFLSVSPVSNFIPSSAGNFKSRLTVTIASDANAGNDMMESLPTELSDSVYARDDNTFAGTQGIGVGPGEDAITGQNFMVNTTDALTSITFFMGDGFGASASGTPVYFTIHPQANDSVEPIEATVTAVSDTIYFTPGMIPPGGAYYTVSLQGGPVSLSPGLYYVGIHETDTILTIGYSNAIFTPGAVWVHWNSIPSPPAVNGWARAEDFTLQLAYMIRANFGPAPNGISEINGSASLAAFPNPASDVLFLKMNGNFRDKDFDVSITNMLGQEKFNGKWDGTGVMGIDVKNYAHGIYFVSARNGDSIVTMKFIVAE